MRDCRRGRPRRDRPCAAGGGRVDGRRARAPGTGRRGHAGPPGRGPRHAPAGHRGRGRRAAAVRQRDPDGVTSSRTARSTTSRSSSGRCRPGPPVPHARPTSRSSLTPTRNGARRSPRGSTACSRIALWDERTRTLVAARDRAGEKPLYYALAGQGLILGSEIKALLRAPGRRARPRPRSARAVPHLRVRHHTADDLPEHPPAAPGALPRVPRQEASGSQRYWDPGVDRRAAVARRGSGRRRSARSSRGRWPSQMMSDVPLGVFLSGGIDSSAVVAFMAEAARRNGATVNSFSMGFEDGSYNELPHARQVARHFGTNHREGLVQPALERPVRSARGAHRRALRRRVDVPDLHGLGDGAAPRDGRAGRGRRRRAVRRLRQLPRRRPSPPGSRRLVPGPAIAGARPAWSR